MKKYIKYLIIAVVGSMFTSCDTDEFLNPLPDSVIVLETFFGSDADVSSGLVGMYDAIQGVNENTTSSLLTTNKGVQLEYLLTEHRSDNTASATLEGTRADFHRYRVDAENLQSEDYYQSMYEAIFRANTVLNYVGNADAANVNKYTAEAKFVRAYAYFNLVRLFGAVPMVTRVVSPGESELLYTRTPVADIYVQIVEDLKAGVSYLDNSSKARASKAAAQGLLAKVYLTQPTPNYADAKLMCEAVIGSNYALEPNFKDVFYNELNDEIIFAIQYEASNPTESQGFSAEFTSHVRQGKQDGLNMVNANLIADFTAAGGNRSAESYAIFGGDSNEVIKFLPAGSDISNLNIPTYGADSKNAGNDWIVLRLADVLLMHVEAAMAGTGNTTDAGALKSFNAVRKRAGLDDDADDIVSLDELLLERRVELAFENHRFFDLVRLGVAESVLSKHSSVMGYTSYTNTALLLPIPSREINLSKGVLTQNPGY